MFVSENTLLLIHLTLIIACGLAARRDNVHQPTFTFFSLSSSVIKDTKSRSSVSHGIYFLWMGLPSNPLVKQLSNSAHTVLYFCYFH